MRKIFKGLLALAAAFSLVACGGNANTPTTSSGGQQQIEQKELLVEKRGVTIPAFEISINGAKITNETMAAYPIYEASVTSTNSSGTTSTVIYIGFKLSDALDAASLTGTADKIIATADDGYEVTWEKGLDNVMIAVSKDGSQMKSYPWFAPCASETTGDFNKNTKKITIEGYSSKDDGDPSAQEADLADPIKEDKTDKINFAPFSFKVNGKEVKNADLEGLHIYRIEVNVVNSKGTVQTYKYSGYLLAEVLDKLGYEASSVEIIASDGYTSELGGGMVKNEYTIIAIERDKEVGKDGTVWVAPCSSHDSSSYAKSVVEIKTK